MVSRSGSHEFCQISCFWVLTWPWCAYRDWTLAFIAKALWVREKHAQTLCQSCHACTFKTSGFPGCPSSQYATYPSKNYGPPLLWAPESSELSLASHACLPNTGHSRFFQEREGSTPFLEISMSFLFFSWHLICYQRLYLSCHHFRRHSTSTQPLRIPDSKHPRPARNPFQREWFPVVYTSLI